MYDDKSMVPMVSVNEVLVISHTCSTAVSLYFYRIGEETSSTGECTVRHKCRQAYQETHTFLHQLYFWMLRWFLFEHNDYVGWPQYQATQYLCSSLINPHNRPLTLSNANYCYEFSTLYYINAFNSISFPTLLLTNRYVTLCISVTRKTLNTVHEAT
jgi:hypothetical protein